MFHDLLPHLKYLNLKAKNEDQFIRNFEREQIPDMKRFLYLTTLVDEGGFDICKYVYKYLYIYMHIHMHMYRIYIYV
jgi:hypothetical protein